MPRRKKSPDFVKLARAAGFWCGEDGEAGFSLFQAHDGNFGPLGERLDGGRLSEEEKTFIKDSLPGRKKQPHRPSSIKVEERQNHIALMVVLAELRGSLQKSAIHDVRNLFGPGSPKESTVEEWVAAFKKDGAKMAFARAIIAYEKATIAAVKRLAESDPDGTWDQPRISIRLASIRRK